MLGSKRTKGDTGCVGFKTPPVHAVSRAKMSFILRYHLGRKPPTKTRDRGRDEIDGAGICLVLIVKCTAGDILACGKGFSSGMFML